MSGRRPTREELEALDQLRRFRDTLWDRLSPEERAAGLFDATLRAAWERLSLEERKKLQWFGDRIDRDHAAVWRPERRRRSETRRVRGCLGDKQRARVQQALMGASSVVVVEHFGLNGRMWNSLRRRVREASGRFVAGANTALRRGLMGTPFERLRGRCRGPTALLVAYADPTAPARAVLAWAREYAAIEYRRPSSARNRGRSGYRAYVRPRPGGSLLLKAVALAGRGEGGRDVARWLLAIAHVRATLLRTLAAPSRDLAVILQARVIADGEQRPAAAAATIET